MALVLPYRGEDLLTLAVLVAAAALLAAIARIDCRTRRIPNRAVGALAGLWLLWRLGLGAYECWMEHAGFYSSTFPLAYRFQSGAWASQPLGLPSAPEALAAAAVVGLGLLACTLAYEALAKREALGGGDVKLMAALALFLGLGRSALCLLVACVVAVAWAALRRRRAGGSGSSAGSDASPADAQGTFAFGPALAIGAAVAVVPGVAAALMW